MPHSDEEVQKKPCRITYRRPKSDEDSDDPYELFVDRKVQCKFLHYTMLVIFIVSWFMVLACLSCIFSKSICNALNEAFYIWYILAGTFASLIIITLTCGSVRYKIPMNAILLGILTLFLGILWAKMSCLIQEYDEDAMILFLLLVYTGVALGVFLVYAHIPCLQFTILGGVIVGGIVLLVEFGASAALYSFFPILYASIGALVFYICVIVDVFLIIDGLHYYQIKPDEYVVAAYHLLIIDIATVFIYICYCCKKKNKPET